MRERVGQMVERKAARQIMVSTFHSLCVRILREDIGRLGYKTNFTIYSGSEQSGLIRRLIVRHGGITEKITPKDVLSSMSRMKNSGLGLDSIEDNLTANIAASYQRELQAQNSVDFDDLLILADKLLKEHRDVREAWQQRFRYITVDEFQDTNSLQMSLLGHLVGPEHNVCVVGDDDQSIYGWRGAQISNILEFERFFSNPSIIKLEENYRCTAPILDTANALIAITWAGGTRRCAPIKAEEKPSGSFPCPETRKKRNSSSRTLKTSAGRKAGPGRISPFCSGPIPRAASLNKRSGNTKFPTAWWARKVFSTARR